MEGIVFAGLSPHPAILVSGVGERELEDIKKTERSMRRLAQDVKDSGADLVITISPHGPVFSDAINILSADNLTGDFGEFGREDIKLSYNLEENFVKELVRASNTQDIALARIDKATARKLNIDLKLDHGVLVPMYYLNQTGIDLPLVPITMGMLSYEELYKLGKIIQLVAQKLDYKVALVTSGDLSHRLKAGAPAGFSPRGREFDEKIVNYLDNLEVEEIFDLDTSLIQKAGECGLRPIMIMLGALDGLAVEGGVLSYEGPFGVGYAVVSYNIVGKDEKRRLFNEIWAKNKERIKNTREHEGELVRLARRAVEEYAKKKEVIDPPAELASEMADRAGVFVSIKKNGNLRGCIGTTDPTQPNIAQEIINNAVSAAFKDPRFASVESKELEELTYSVDILGEPEKIDSKDKLDPKECGVIVKKDGRAGLLLPNLEGVDTVDKQVEIAKRKAGIALEEDVELFRFKVKRYK